MRNRVMCVFESMFVKGFGWNGNINWNGIGKLEYLWEIFVRADRFLSR